MKPIFFLKRLTSDKKIILSAFFVLILLIFFFMPALVFNANASFLSGQYLELLSYSLWSCVLISVTIAVLVFLLPERTCQYLAPLTFYLAISGLLMGVYISSNIVDVGLVDGTDQVLELKILYVLTEIFISIFFIVGLYFYYPKLKKLLQDALIMIMLLVVGVSAYATYTDFRMNYYRLNAEASEDKDLFRLSEKENILVFLFDTLSADFLSALLDEDPELSKKLDGFTFFRDTISVSPTTYLALPTIHSGQYLDPAYSIMDGYDDYIGKQSFLTETVNSGANSILLNRMITCPEQVSCINSSEVLSTGGRQNILDWSMLIDISIFRLLPYSIKPLIYNDGEWYFHHKLELRSPLLVDSLRDNELLLDFSNKIYVEEGKPQVKFLHLFNTHYPFNLSRDCELIEANNYDINLALNSARCGINRFVNILEKLKELGVYDSSLIAVIADHGAHMGYVSPEEVDRIDVNDSLLFQINTPMTSSQLENFPSNINNAKPIFIIKRPDIQGDLVVDSRRAVSLMDFPATLCQYTQLCQMEGYDAFNAPTNASERVRLYNDYTWQTEFWSASDLEEHVTQKRINFSLLNDGGQAHIESEAFQFNQKGLTFTGFGLVENWGRWNEGYESVLNICFADSATNNINLVFEVRAFLREESPRQRVAIRINEELIAEEVYELDSYTSIYNDLYVPLKDIKLDNESCLDLVFELPDATLPNIETPNDKRLLALGFKSLRIERVGSSL